MLTLNKKIWEQFIAHQPTSLKEIRPEIARSWKRCLDTPLDPYQKQAVFPVASVKLQSTQGQIQLRTCFHTMVEQFHLLLQHPKNPLLVLATPSGYILERFGNLEVAQQADEIGFQVGRLWSNQSIGTNAIGQAMLTDQPVGVTGYEHFVTLSHAWTCFAQKIRDPQGQCQGILDLSFHGDYPLTQGKELLQWLAEYLTLKLAQTAKVPKTQHIKPKDTQIFIYGGIPTASPSYQRFLKKVQLAANSSVAVHVSGESGSGKELIARALHDNSPYRNGPLVSVNCGALSDDLLQSELFGYAGGAFTGANPKGYIGKFMQANRGTLFLDEVNSMSVKMQSALLRVLEDHWVTPIGSDKPQKVDFRLVTASNQDLRKLVEQNLFRMDLFYRIYVSALTIPPLRDHFEDLSPLIHSFCEEKNWHLTWQDTLIKIAMSHRWPGNIREFYNFLERLHLYYQDEEPTVEQITDLLQLAPTVQAPVPKTSLTLSEPDQILYTLQKNQNQLNKTALELGISRSTLYRKIKKYHLKIK